MSEIDLLRAEISRLTKERDAAEQQVKDATKLLDHVILETSTAASDWGLPHIAKLCEALLDRWKERQK